MAVASAGKSSPTITADALVVRAAGAYLGLETNVSSPGPACSIPLSPVISVSGEPFSRRAPSAEAIAESFMGYRLLRLNRTPATLFGREVAVEDPHSSKITKSGNVSRLDPRYGNETAIPRS